MIEISEVDIISIDKSDVTWEIEGEIVFESDFTTAFSAGYSPDDDELENLDLEMEPGRFDRKALKEMIVEAAQNYDE